MAKKINHLNIDLDGDGVAERYDLAGEGGGGGEGTSVVPNPPDPAAGPLNKIKIENTTYTVGESDYTNFRNKPKINGVTLEGEVSLTDIKVAPSVHKHEISDINNLNLSDKLDIQQGIANKDKVLQVGNDGNITLVNSETIGSKVSASSTGAPTTPEKAKYLTINDSTWELAGGTSDNIYAKDIIYSNVDSELTAEEVQSAIDEVTVLIKNKKDVIPNPEEVSEEAPELTSIRINNIDYKISGEEQIQSDWTEEDEKSKAFIQNKPLDLVHINNDITEIQVLIK